MNKFAIALLIGALALPERLTAASYTFDILYEGGGASVLPGSDDPVGTVLFPGDSFEWSIQAERGYYWHTTADTAPFPFMSFKVPEGDVRVGDVTLNLSYLGTTTFSFSETDVVQRFNHVGTDAVPLLAGLMFDRMHLSYTLTSATKTTTLSERLIFIGAPEDYGFIEYVAASVPDTASAMALLFPALIGMGLLARRRGRNRVG